MSEQTQSANNSELLDAVIIGSGFSGIGMAIQLLKHKRSNFKILERAPEIGGTWRDNTYPGCACDVPSHLYSFSFEPNPNWSRKYSPHHEIHAYLKRCVEKYSLEKKTEFNADVTEARFDENAKVWVVSTRGGSSFTARCLITGTGPLNKPVIPIIAGADTFEGPSFHSSEWDHDFDWSDRNVAVIGTGASAIQIVPAIAEKAKNLCLYQRTAPWVVPRWDRGISKIERFLYRWIPPIRWAYRNLIFWYQEQLGFAFFTNIGTHKNVEKLAKWHMRKAIKDPALQEKLTPNYRIGCKRILISDDYYPALARDNVEVISDDVAKIDRNGIVSGAGEHRPADAIIYATGFAATEFIAPMKIYGRDNRELSEEWKQTAQSLLGITTSGFPNLFMIIGPNTGLGHNSMVFMIEAQINYILSCLKMMEKRGIESVDLKQETQREFSNEIQEKLAKTTWMSGCKSWYLSPDGHNYTLWPGFCVSYWMKTRSFNPAHYELY